MQYLAKKPYLVIFIFTVVLVIFFDVVLGIEDILIRSSISSFIAVLLAPRKKKIKTQTGTKTQVTWIFLKKPIIID
jgi:hypothetical protein